MVCTFRAGSASGAGSVAYARYVVEGALASDQMRAAQYYAGDVQGRDFLESVIQLRKDIAPELAKVLGVDGSRSLTLTEMAHLLNNRTVAGAEIEGKKKHSPHQSVASVFGLDAERLPTVSEVENVLAGKRVDGTPPLSDKGNGPPLSAERIESSLRQFKRAIGVPGERDATAEEIQRVADGLMDVADYRRKITATNPPVGFVDLTFSSDKSVGIAYAQASTEAERELIKSLVHAATDDAMAYAEAVLGQARRGSGGAGETEASSFMWMTLQHYTARPAADIVRLDAQGQEYTDTRSVPGAADVSLHQHRIVPSTIVTPDGHVGSLDLNRLKGETKVIGAVFHASLATRLRDAGIAAELGPNGEARIPGQPEWVRKFHSRRTTQGEEAAKEWAASVGKVWAKLNADEKAKLLSEGAAKTREAKTPADKRQTDEGVGDIERWQAEAKAAGYRHKSVLGTHKPRHVSDADRLEIARNTSLKLLDAAFQKRSVLSEGEVREIAARGLVASGVGANAADDIAAVIKTFHERGVRVHGKATKLITGTDVEKNGRMRRFVTTESAVALEESVIKLVRAAAADKSSALTRQQVDQAAERFLARNPKVDRDGDQWKSQKDMARRIGEGGRVSLSIGVAGSGKTSAVIASLVDAWHQQGRTVYGMTVPWKASDALHDAKVDEALSIAAFLHRVQKGKIHVDSNTVIVADEVSQIGVQHQAALLNLAAQTGAQLVEIGDPKQCQSIDTPAIDLMAHAMGDENIPKLLTTIRQKTERDRAVATMFRDGKAAEGIEALQEDGRFHLIAGGKSRVIEETTALWRTMTNANASNPDYKLLVMTPTNAQALEVGLAIRANRRAAREIGETDVVLKAMDPNSKETFSLPVATGDKIRMFTRTHDADTPGHSKVLSSNGDVVEVRAVLPDGLRIRNEAGEEGRVTWAQMKPFRAPKNDPVRVTLGYAVTVDTAQSLTRSAAILVAPEGSRQLSGFKGYTGLSRHVEQAHLVISDAADRLEIISRQMLGEHQTPSRADVIRNVAANLSRFEKKRQAINVVDQAISVRRSEVAEATTPNTQLEPLRPPQATQEPAKEAIPLTPEIQALLDRADAIRNTAIVYAPTQEETEVLRRAYLVAAGRMTFGEALDDMALRYIRQGGDIDKLDDAQERYSKLLAAAIQEAAEGGDKQAVILAMQATQPAKTIQAARDAAWEAATPEASHVVPAHAREAQKPTHTQGL